MSDCCALLPASLLCPTSNPPPRQGVMESAEGLCALTNPSDNSYKRLNARATRSGATWSPVGVSWAGNNRSHMVRVPAPGRFEFRLPDGAANPYLLQAGIIAAGLSGVERRVDPGPPSTTNLYDGAAAAKVEAAAGAVTRSVPCSLLDAVKALKADAVLAEGLGREFVESYAKLKTQAWLDSNAVISQHELDTTLDV